MALLGRYPGCPEFLKVYKEIQRRRALCREAEEEFERHLKSQSDVSDSTAAEGALGQHEPAAGREPRTAGCEDRI